MNNHIENIKLLCEELFETKFINENNISTFGYSDSNEYFSYFLGNYLMLQNEVINDLELIETNLVSINMNTSKYSHTDYEYRKLEFFKRINQKAKEEIGKYLIENLLQDVLNRVASKKYWVRSNGYFDKLSYEFSFYKKYYSPDYDYSTDTKLRFIDSSRILEMMNLKLISKNEYLIELIKIIEEYNILDEICLLISENHILCKRIEIFEELRNLYNIGKYQTFINLAVIQVEALFFDLCFMINDEQIVKDYGTLSVKAEKAFVNNQVLWKIFYPYFAFEAPIYRNQIAHTGFVENDNLKGFCNEVIADMYAIINSMKSTRKIPYCIINDIKAMRQIIKTIEISEDDYRTVFLTVFVGAINPLEVFNLLKNVEIHKKTLLFYKIKVNETEFTTLYEECLRLKLILFQTNHWDEIIELLREEKVNEKSTTLINFARSLRDSFISEKGIDPIIKTKCIEISKELKRHQ